MDGLEGTSGASRFEIVRLEETDSTNRVAAEIGRPWQAFCANHQTAGRGRIGHRWIAPPGVNLALSAVLPVADWSPEAVSTLPLVVGLAVLRAVEFFVDAATPPCRRVTLKWPNDILIDGLKVSGILCERRRDGVIAGIGVNVLPHDFPPEIAATATCLGGPSVDEVARRVLAELARHYDIAASAGFAALYPEFASVDHLRGRVLAVRQTDDDAAPVRGVCGGIAPDGSLLVGDVRIYAGEAHVVVGQFRPS